MPTSAAWSATASFTPSPRKATSTPVRRATLMIRAFWSGLTRANTVVLGMAVARSSSLIVVSSSPLSTPFTPRPSWVHTVVATTPLSPVITFTSIPMAARRASEFAASAFGRSMNVRKPSRCRSRSSALVGPAPVAGVASVNGLLATATTRAPTAKRSATKA